MKEPKVFDKYSFECTYVPFRDAMNIQKLLSKANGIHIKVTLNDRGSTPPEIVYCNRKCPRFIYPCQNYGNFSWPFVVTPPLCSKDNKNIRLLWVMTNLLNNSKHFWRLIDYNSED